jgi:hypothetical protein
MRKRSIVGLASHPDAFVTVQGSGTLPAYRFPPITGDWRIRTADAIAFAERARCSSPQQRALMLTGQNGKAAKKR